MGLSDNFVYCSSIKVTLVKLSSLTNIYLLLYWVGVNRQKEEKKQRQLEHKKTNNKRKTFVM